MKLVTTTGQPAASNYTLSATLKQANNFLPSHFLTCNGSSAGIGQVVRPPGRPARAGEERNTMRAESNSFYMPTRLYIELQIRRAGFLPLYCPNCDKPCLWPEPERARNATTQTEPSVYICNPCGNSESIDAYVNLNKNLSNGEVSI